MHLIRISCLGLLVALIGLTSQTMVVARGHAAAAGEVVLCTGAGIQTIQVDADGNPTQGAHYCPECVLVAWVDDRTPNLSEWSGVVLPNAAHPAVSLVRAVSTTRGLGARGPPLQA